MFGWQPNPSGVESVLAALPHPGECYAAAPQWMGDGMTGDLLSYRAWYETEVLGPDGNVWKAKGKEPPWRQQLGNNCTAEAVRRVLLLLQCMEAADPGTDATDIVIPADACVEATYAFGLYKAGWRGDVGCYGGAMAAALHEIGAIPYQVAGEPFDEDFRRLETWANDPQSVVFQFRDKAGQCRAGSIVRVTTWQEACGVIANRGLLTIASSVGYETRRDSRGICRAAGRWDHQMAGVAIIRSDGVESIVEAQSWGPGNPSGFGAEMRLINGPQPFGLPSFCFRAVREDFERQLAAGDTWGVRLFPGFARKSLPPKWTSAAWGG